MLLFVQRARQLLLHTSSLLCRSSRAAPFTIVRELNYLLTKHKETPHTSTSANVKLLVDELNDSIRKDPIAKDLIGDRFEIVCRTLVNDSDVNIQLESARILLNRLAQKQYFDKSAELITNIICTGGREKEKLLNLTDGYVAGIRDAGYPAQTIYHLLNVSFLDKTRAKMSAKDRLKKFFSYFDLARHSYSVYFSISDIAPGVAPTFTSVSSKFLDRASDEAANIIEALPASTKRFFTSHPYQAIVCFDKIKALDPQSARQEAERRLRLLDDLLKFSAHRKRFSIQNPAVILIEDKEGAAPIHSNRPRSPILQVPHDSVGIATEGLSQFAPIFSNLRGNSMYRFIRALELHGTALAAPEEESQLLNIWIAFETLFVRRGDGSKIKEVVSSVQPYVCSCWVSYLFAELFSEISTSHKEKWLRLLDAAPELQSLPEQVSLAAAISVKKFEPQVTAFLAELDDDPLLRQRIFLCIGWAQTSKNIIQFQRDISDRVNYDLNRIYRTRNQVVHSGRSSDGVGEVVQSAHFYLDIVLNLLSIMFGQPGGPRTIEQANMEALIQFTGHQKILTDAASISKECGIENFVELLFGRPLLG